MNKLYSLLTQNISVPDEYSWYAKRTSIIAPTSKALKLIRIVVNNVPVARLALYVSVLCNLVLCTQYAKEISKLDPANTYFPVTRDPNQAHSDTEYGITDLIQPIDTYKNIIPLLDPDIRDTLDTDSWFDMMGAACLQILREMSR